MVSDLLSFAHRLRERPQWRRVAANAGWLVGERAARIAVGLVVTVWVARYLGPAHYGELAFALAYAALWGAVGNLGLEAVTVRELSRRPGEAGAVLGTAAALRALGSLAVTVAALASMSALGMASAERALLTAVVLFSLVFQSAEIVDSWFQAHLLSRLTVVSRLSAFALAAAAKVSLVLLAAPLIAFAWVVLLEAALAGVFMAVNYVRRRGGLRLRWNAREARSLLRDSLPVMLSALATAIYMRIDQVMLSELASPAELGLFSAVLPFSEGWYVLATSVCTSLLPALSRTYADDPPAFARQLHKLLVALAGAGLLIAAVMSLASGLVVELLLGSRYAGSAPVLAIHAWAIVFVFVGVGENVWLISGNHVGLRLAKMLLGALTNVGLNLWLIPRYGACGAAAATVVSYAVAVYASNLVLAPRMFRLQSRALFLRPPQPDGMAALR